MLWNKIFTRLLVFFVFSYGYCAAQTTYYFDKIETSGQTMDLRNTVSVDSMHIVWDQGELGIVNFTVSKINRLPENTTEYYLSNDHGSGKLRLSANAPVKIEIQWTTDTTRVYLLKSEPG